MYEVDDYVMYGLTGACKVTDIRCDDEGTNKERRYYILSPLKENDSIIMIPVMNKEIRMRKVISKDTAESMLEVVKSENLDWIDDHKERGKVYTELLKEGSPETWLKLIKILQDEKVEKQKEGKKLSSSDESILKSATNLVNGEFSVALKMGCDEVSAYIRQYMQN